VNHATLADSHQPYSSRSVYVRSILSMPSASGRSLVSIFLSYSFRPLEVANQFRDVVWLLAGILGMLVAEKLGDATG